METQTYARKPFYVQAVRVTEENFEKVAEWTKGKIESAKQGKFIKVDVQKVIYDRQTQAFVGDWVLCSKVGEVDSFKVYTNSAFVKSFEIVKTDELAEALKNHFEGQTVIDIR